MNGYPGYFFEHWGQVTALATTAAVWLGFADKLRFDRHPPVPFFREVGRAVAAALTPRGRWP